jgi:hypothetical protein
MMLRHLSLDQRRALALMAGADMNGVTETMMLARGFTLAMIGVLETRNCTVEACQGRRKDDRSRPLHDHGHRQANTRRAIEPIPTSIRNSMTNLSAQERPAAAGVGLLRGGCPDAASRGPDPSYRFFKGSGLQL